ncbi:MAG: glycine dehydrogenase (aminomethyl-transferring), partial [Candidatus Marinimicrobia bacterium]|nr:glycine dehydrogenase (aminomethyl-transferring) [Candidatus Neomarinimicrobiota bacterium]
MLSTSIRLREQPFAERHISPDPTEVTDMLQSIGVSSIDQLIKEAIPSSIMFDKDLDLPEALGEHEFLSSFKKMFAKNKVMRSYIGMGYYGTLTPTVILRNILENPGWYTAYTPYQAEIAQGRLEALINFQTLVIELTGMPIANASLLDEGTAAAEAISMFYGKRSRSKKKAEKFFVDQNVFPQTLDIIKTRTASAGIEIVIGSLEELDLTDETLFGIYVQYPNNDGAVIDISSLIATANEQEVLVAVGADLLSLTLLTPPGEMGADAVIGTTQRFGVPMGYGGPHAAYFATLKKYKRQIPGRIIGQSLDVHGNIAYRVAL